MIPGGKTATEWHGEGVTRKRLTTTALNRGNRCHCGMRPDRKTVTEWSVEGTTRRWLTTTALNRGNCCRCGKRKRPAATKRRPIWQKDYLCKIMKQPLNNSSRIESVDALRGFAVMAIVLVHNLEHFIYPVYPTDAPAWLGTLDRIVRTGPSPFSRERPTPFSPCSSV